MSDGILSYKKPSGKSEDEVPPVAPQSPKVSTSELAVPPNPAGKRQVLAGRRKLQEFYHLQAELNKQKEQQTKETSQPAEPMTITSENSLQLLSSPKQLSNYLKSNSLRDILKLRNSIAHNLSSHDSEMKSIIYDNYYELIKLSETLASLTSNSSGKSVSSGTLFGERMPLHNTVVDGKYLDATFQDLISFVDSDVTYFNSKFEDLIDKSADVAGDDASSVKGMLGNNDKTIEDVDTTALQQEIDFLLSGAPQTEENRLSLVASVDLLLTDLGDRNKLLSNQLQLVAERFREQKTV